MAQTKSSKRNSSDDNPSNNDSKVATKSQRKGRKSRKKSLQEMNSEPLVPRDMVSFEESWSGMQASISKLKNLLEGVSEV